MNRLARKKFFAVSTALLLFVAAVHSQNAPDLYLESLRNFEPHAESVWHTASGTGRPPDSGYFGDGNSDGNGGIRGSCGIAVAYAVLVRAAPPGDPKQATRIARLRQALNYAANTHTSGTNTCIDGKKWGHSWQSALWAGSMGFACQLVESNLPVATIQAVKRAIADEATYRSGIPPATGYIGNTACEENAWNSTIVSLAAAWLSTNANAAAWLTSAKQYLCNTYTVANTNGDPLAAWVTTVTTYPSYAIENHGFYHPSYQTDGATSLGDSLLMARSANPAIATQLQPFAEHNVMNVWGHLSHVLLDSGEYAYPSGLDWALHSYEQNSCYAWLATHFNDPLARRGDERLAALTRYRQIVNGDGRFVGESEPNGFYREAVEARSTAFAYLHYINADFPTGPVAEPGSFVQHYSDIKMIEQRGPFGFVSLSYGPVILGLVIPPAVSVPTNAYLITPRSPGVIGLGALGAPTSAQLISFATNANGFTAELLLQNGTKGSTRAYVKSTGESVAIVEVPLPAGNALATAAGSFSVGIENHKLTGGSRLIQWAGGATNVLERSGVTRYVSNRWVCVAGQYGVAAGPSGVFRYDAASTYNRLGAAEDTLSFVPTESLRPRYAVWFPGKNANATMTNAALVQWTLSGTNGVLTFPGPGGALQQLNAVVPPYQAWPYALTATTVSASSFEPGYPPSQTVDGTTTTFWNSAGQLPGEGPTPAHPEWLDYTFNRTVGILGVDISPRLQYGPKNIQVIVGTNILWSGIMADAAISIRTNQPLEATNARIFITGAFDRGSPSNPRSVQVAEVVFVERAVPGTFLDWQLRNFTTNQMASTSISGPDADPDADQRSNAWEFIHGLNPLSAEAGSAAPTVRLADATHIVLRFRERNDLGDVSRRFMARTSLTSGIWGEVIPQQIVNVSDLGNAWLREATLLTDGQPRFLRLEYRLP